MKLFQTLVFTLVLFGNIYWEWTPNGYVASLLGGLAAFFATTLTVWCGDRLRDLGLRINHHPSARIRRRQQRIHQGILPPALPRR